MTPEALDALVDAGATAEMIAAAWKAEMVAPRERTKAALRQERYRQRQEASQNVTTTSQNVTGDACDEITPPSSPPNKSPPNPQKLTPPPTPTEIYTPRARAVSVFPMPAGVNPQHWADFLTNRKAKKAQNTATAHKRLLDDLTRWTDDEWPPGRLIEHAAAKGWAGIYNPRQDEKNGNLQSRRPTERDPLMVALERARAEEAAEYREQAAQADYPRIGHSLSASGPH